MTSMFMNLFTLVMMAFWMIPCVAFAQAATTESSTTTKTAPTSPSPTLPSTTIAGPKQTRPMPIKPWLAFGAEMGVGSINHDYTLDLLPYIGFYIPVPQPLCQDHGCQTTLTLELSIPLRLTVYDTPPTHKESIIRYEDWDTPSDYPRFIDTIHYGNPDEPLYINIGKLHQVTLGHGTQVLNYTNTLDPNRYKLGYQLEVHSRYAGGSMLIDDLVSPELAGGRVYIRPFQMSPSGLFIDKLSIGASFFSHLNAPKTLDTRNSVIQITEDQRPKVLTREHQFIWGLDLDVLSYESLSALVRHYFDFNFRGLKIGVHIGTETQIHLNSDWTLNLKGELRALGKGYFPAYVSYLFETTQFTLDGWDNQGQTLTLSQTANTIDASGMGGMLAASFQYKNWITAGIMYEGHHGGKNDRLTFHLHANIDNWVTASLFYYNPESDFSLDLIDPRRAHITTAVRGTFYGPFYAYGQYTHRLLFKNLAKRSAAHDWSLGAGVHFEM